MKSAKRFVKNVGTSSHLILMIYYKNFTFYHVTITYSRVRYYISIAHIVIETFSEQLWRVSEVRNRRANCVFPHFFGEAGRLNASATNSGFRNRLSATQQLSFPSSRPRRNLAHHMASRSTRGTAINTIAPVRACAAHVHTAHSLASETYVDRGRV